MDEDEGWQVIDEHRLALADFLDTLTPQQWAAPSLCDGWTVKDVAAHLSYAASFRYAELVAAVVRARGNFDRMIHQTGVDRAATRTTDQVVADLRAIIGSRRLAPTTSWRDPLLDVLVHAQDIARPLGLDLATPAEPARVAADWAWERGAPFHPSRRMAGTRLVADDVDWIRGEGREVRGPIVSLLLLSTGRAAAVTEAA